MKKSRMLITLSVILLASLAWAQVPQTINYQGVLKDNSGNIVADDNYELTFRLYDASAGGTEWWSETHAGVLVTDGIFNVILGSITSFISTVPKTKFEIPYWLEIAVGGLTLSSRIQLTAVPYSITTRSVQGYMNVFPSNGNVGIGTTTPGEKLEVLGNIGVNDYDLYLRSDRLHGIGAYSDTKKFGTIAMDGPIVYGAGGGALGTNDGSLQNIALYWNQAGNVGIGTATPYGFTKLHIYDAAQASLMIEGEGDAWNYSQLVLGSGANNKTWALLHGKAIGMENKLQIQEYDGAAYSPRLVIQPGGNVGIGTTSPEAMLHIASPDAGGLILTDRSGRYSATLRNFGLGGQLNLLDSLQASGARIRGYAYNGVQAYFTAGNVGIGTNSPSAKLEVVGTIKADTLQLTTPAERWYAIPGPEFRHAKNWYQNSSAYHVSTSMDGDFWAPVHLPHGSTITGFEVTFTDDDSTNADITLYSVFQGNETATPIASLSTSGSTATNTISNLTLTQAVDNQNYTYMVRAYWVQAKWQYDLLLRNARIRYTVDQPLP